MIFGDLRYLIEFFMHGKWQLLRSSNSTEDCIECVAWWLHVGMTMRVRDSWLLN